MLKVKTKRCLSIALAAAFMASITNIPASAASTNTYSVDYFPAEYSSGYFYPSTEITAGSGLSTGTTMPLSWNTSFTYNNINYSGTVGMTLSVSSNLTNYYASNTSKQNDIYIDAYNAMVYDGEYYDVRMYAWLSETDEADAAVWSFCYNPSNTTMYNDYIYCAGYYSDTSNIIDDGNGNVGPDTVGAMTGVTMEFHFYKAGTLATSNPEEVEVKGITQHLDLDLNEGFTTDSSSSNVWLDADTTIVYNTTYGAYLGTIEDESYGDVDANGNIITDSTTANDTTTMWEAFTGSASDPYIITFYTDEGRLSSLPYLGSEIDYTLVNNGQNSLPSSASAPTGTYAANYSYYNTIDGDDIDHYTFSGWFTDRSLTTAADTTLTVNSSDITLYGTYYADQYDVTTDVTNGTITASDTYNYGDDVTITYTPDTGYKLSSVAVDGSSVSTTTYPSSYTFSDIDADHEISVVYEKETYDITTSVTNGTITPSSTVEYGDTATITYTPDAGYKLASVTVDGSSVNISTYPSSYTFSNISGDHEISVVYEKETYDITTNVTNGTITPGSTVEYGDTATVTYTPDTGYQLSSVTVDGTPVDITTYPSSYTFSDIDSDHEIDVVYEVITYDITTSVTNGTITPSQTIDYGDTTTITYAPGTGYELSSVTVDGTPVDITVYPSSYTFSNVTADHEIAVVYETTELNISTSVTNGTITPGSIVNYGDTAVIEYSPNTGYSLESVIVDGTPVDIATYPSSYTFSDITENHSISVVYAKNTYTITTNVTNGTITGSSTVNYGDDATVTYAPNPGYSLESVTIDGVSVDISLYPSNCTFTSVSSNHEISVVYAKNTYNITTSVTNGTITPSTGAEYGDTVVISYAPNTGYSISSVLVDGAAVNIDDYPAAYTFTGIAANHEISVVYEKNEYTITTNVANGTITPSPTVTYGDSSAIYYTPNTGYTLSSITVDGSAVSTSDYPTSYTFDNVSDNHSITVVYSKNAYTINTSVTNGTITDSTSAEYGDTKTIYYMPNTGYALSSVTVDGTPVDITLYPNSYVFEDIASNHSIAVVYELNQFDINTSVINGTITPTTTVTKGESTVVKYTPDSGYELYSVTVDGTPVDITQYPDSYTFTDITESHTISVIFIDKSASITDNLPVIGATAPIQINYGDTCDNTVTVNDADLGDILTVTRSIDGGDTETINTVTSTTEDITFDDPIDGLSVGEHMFYYEVTDAANNKANITVTTTVVDNSSNNDNTSASTSYATGGVITPTTSATTAESTATESETTTAATDNTDDVTITTTANTDDHDATTTTTSAATEATTVTTAEITDIVVTPKTNVEYIGSTITLTATITPSTADQAVVWTSSDPSIASVDQNGIVSCWSVGTVTITATASNGDYDTATVTVIDTSLSNPASYYPYYYYGSVITDNNDGTDHFISDIDLDDNALIEHVDVGAGIESDDDIISDADEAAIENVTIGDTYPDIAEDETIPVYDEASDLIVVLPTDNNSQTITIEPTSPKTGNADNMAAIAGIMALASAIILKRKLK